MNVARRKELRALATGAQRIVDALDRLLTEEPNEDAIEHIERATDSIEVAIEAMIAAVQL